MIMLNRVKDLNGLLSHRQDEKIIKLLRLRDEKLLWEGTTDELLDASNKSTYRYYYVYSMFVNHDAKLCIYVSRKPVDDWAREIDKLIY